MQYLSVIRQKSLTERNKTDTCPLTDSKRVHVIDQTISLLSNYLTDSLPSNWLTDTCNSGLTCPLFNSWKDCDTLKWFGTNVKYQVIYLVYDFTFLYKKVDSIQWHTGETRLLSFRFQSTCLDFNCKSRLKPLLAHPSTTHHLNDTHIMDTDI